MKSIKSIFIAGVFLLLMVGCGGGSSDHDDGGGSDDAISYLEVINSEISDSDICEVYSSLSSSDEWGADRLSGTIAPDDYRTFSTYNCDRLYDLRVVFCDGYEDEVFEYYRECGTTRSFEFVNW